MKSHEAMKKAIGAKTEEFARALRKSAALIHKWCEPSQDYTDSGAYNPLDRLELIIEKSLSLNTKPEEAHAPIYYLAERFGLILTPLPASGYSVEKVAGDLIRTVTEVGHVSELTAAALTDGKITEREAGRIEAESWHVIRRAVIFMGNVKNSIVRREESRRVA